MKKGKKLKERDKKGFKYYLKRDWQLYVLLFFPLAFAIVFKFLPLLGLSVAFLNYDVVGGFERAKFIGFDAFKEIFKMKDFYIALRNTIVLNGLDLIIGNEDENDQRPSQQHRHVRRRRPEAEQRGKA